VVYAAADQLGSFANGQDRIAVVADAGGMAIIDVLIGIDQGEYTFSVASPACRGVLVFRRDTYR
jgi:hypothetical protein